MKRKEVTVILDTLVAWHIAPLSKWGDVLPFLLQIKEGKSIWISRLYKFLNINSSEA